MKAEYASKSKAIKKDNNKGKKPVVMIKDKVVKNAKVPATKRKPAI